VRSSRDPQLFAAPAGGHRGGLVRGGLVGNVHFDEIACSLLSDAAGLVGASFMVVDELLSPQRLPLWIHHGSPAGHADLIHGVSVAARHDVASALVV
jgi:hypothetical protein